MTFDPKQQPTEEMFFFFILINSKAKRLKKKKKAGGDGVTLAGYDGNILSFPNQVELPPFPRPLFLFVFLLGSHTKMPWCRSFSHVEEVLKGPH